MIKRVLLPLYEREEDSPAFDHALWLAERFDAELLITTAVDKSRFMNVAAGYAEAAVWAVDRHALRAFVSQIRSAAGELIARATARERLASATPQPCSFPDGLTALTRQCDILVESKLHRNPFLSRKLLDKSDLYTDASCPILIARGEPSELCRPLLVYTRSSAANRALRWVVRLAEHTGARIHVLVLHDEQPAREGLREEVANYCHAHSLEVGRCVITAAERFQAAVGLSRGLRPGVVALPVHAFKRPLRLRVQGLDEKALNQLECSALLFP